MIYNLKITGISIVLLNFLFIPFSDITAQDPGKLVHKIIDKYQNAQTLKLDFEFQLSYPEQDPEILKGEFRKTGDQYRVDLKDYVIISDGKVQYTVQNLAREVQITDVDDETMELSSPSGILKYLSQNEFKYFDKTELNQGPESLRVTEMVPQDRNSEYFKIRFSSTTKEELLRYIEIFARDGTRIQLTVNSTSFAKNFTPQSIAWNADQFKDFYIEDLRID